MMTGNLFFFNSTLMEPSKPEAKPIILNSTLNKASDSCNTNPEPWVVKQNGEVEKVIQPQKILNGTDKFYNKSDDGKKISFIIKRQISDECHVKQRLHKGEVDSRMVDEVSNGMDKCATTGKMGKNPKSPLEKLEEQMKKSDAAHSARSGPSSSSRLVPYDSESSGDERPERASASALADRSTHRAWTVSTESGGPLLSPSLNGVTAKEVKEDERPPEKEKSPNTSVSSMSPLSDRSEATAASAAATVNAATATASATGTATATASTAKVKAVGPLHAHETLRQLQTHSHRGYGQPVASWNGNHSALSRQVFEERRDERKRALDAVDEIDRGRNKKVKKFHPYNRFMNNRNGYNAFQDKQNKPHWSNNFKYRGERRPHHFKHHNNKYKRFNRYSNGYHYPRHH